MFSGGEVARAILRDGYRIVVYRPTLRGSPLPRVGPFVQMKWTPAVGLPKEVADEVDLDGDGMRDVQVRLKLVVDVVPLDRRYQPMHSAGVTSFAALIARVGDDIVVRFPLETATAR